MIEVNETERDTISKLSEDRYSVANSLSTMESLAATEYLNRNHCRFSSNDLPEFIPNLSQNSVKIEHVSECNMIYNIYSIPSMPETSVNDQSSTSNQEQSSSSESSWRVEKPKKQLKIIARNFIVRRKVWIAGTFSVVIIVFLIWLIFYLLTYSNPTTLINRETTLHIFSRSEWGAEKPKRELSSLSLPIRRIIIAHTADDNASCFDSNQCKLRVKKIQEDNLELDDIPYNFLIGGDGSIFEGRGIEFKGQHTSNVNGSSYDEIGIGVAFIGTCTSSLPLMKQIDAFHKFVEYFINKNMITEDHKIFLQDHLSKQKIPADSLFETVKTFKNFRPGKVEFNHNKISIEV